MAHRVAAGRSRVSRKRLVARQAFAETADIAQAEQLPGSRQRVSADDSGLHLGQFAFAPIGMPFVQCVGDAEVDHRIAEELHALVVAVVFGAANVFGGFMVTDRMLQMFKKKK